MKISELIMKKEFKIKIQNENQIKFTTRHKKGFLLESKHYLL